MGRLYNTHAICQWGWAGLGFIRAGVHPPNLADISSPYRRTSNPSLRRFDLVICCVLPAKLMAAMTSRSGPNTGASPLPRRS